MVRQFTVYRQNLSMLNVILLFYCPQSLFSVTFTILRYEWRRRPHGKFSRNREIAERDRQSSGIRRQYSCDDIRFGILIWSACTNHWQSLSNLLSSEWCRVGLKEMTLKFLTRFGVEKCSPNAKKVPHPSQTQDNQSCQELWDLVLRQLWPLRDSSRNWAAMQT
jgi:hypothetical protein